MDCLLFKGSESSNFFNWFLFHIFVIGVHILAKNELKKNNNFEDINIILFIWRSEPSYFSKFHNQVSSIQTPKTIFSLIALRLFFLLLRLSFFPLAFFSMLFLFLIFPFLTVASVPLVTFFLFTIPFNFLISFFMSQISALRFYF